MKNPVWVVTAVKPQKNYTLLLTFADGTKKCYNAKPLLNKLIYKQLKNPAFFAQAKAECGTVVWNEEIDIAPEYLYENSLPADNISGT